MMTKLSYACVAFLAMSLLVSAQDQESDLAKMQGDWIPDFMYTSNKIVPKDLLLRNFVLRNEGRTMTLFVGKAVIARTTNTYDSSRNPKTFEYTVEKGKKKGEEVVGIYELQGDTLKICVSSSGQGVPKDFSIPKKKGDGMIMFLHRAK